MSLAFFTFPVRASQMAVQSFSFPAFDGIFWILDSDEKINTSLLHLLPTQLHKSEVFWLYCGPIHGGIRRDWAPQHVKDPTPLHWSPSPSLWPFHILLYFPIVF